MYTDVSRAHSITNSPHASQRLPKGRGTAAGARLDAERLARE
jgi:hypothetical protein